MSGSNELGTLATVCSYVVNFIVHFAIELALRLLLLKEGITPGNIHDLSQLYNKLSEQTRKSLQ